MKTEERIALGVFLVWTLILILFTSITGYNGLYGQDSYEYLRYAVRLSEFIREGIPPGNYFWPVNYPLAGALLSFVTGPRIALQLLAILSSSWILYLCCSVLFREFPGREKEVVGYTVLFLGLSPYFFRYAVSDMSDIPALAMACTSYYALYCGIRLKNSRWLFGTLFFASMAVFTRMAYIIIMIPPMLLCIYYLVKQQKFLLVVLSTLAAFIPALVFLYFKQSQAGSIFNHFLVTNWSIPNFFRNEFNTPDGISHYQLPNIIYVLAVFIHPGIVFPGLIFLVIFIRKKRKPSLLYPVVVAGVFCYLIFIAGLPSRNARFLVPVIPFFVIACFPVYLVILAWLYERKSWRTLIFCLGIILQLSLVTGSFLPMYVYNKQEAFISQKIIDYHPEVIYTFGIDGALRCYGYKGTIINMWDQPLHTILPNSMMLFNKKKNAVQWKEKNPMNNFAFITDSAHARLMEQLTDGWEIYDIKEAYPPVDSRIP